ncbi:homoprotocatechuate degradation operon regulator HpaR [Phaeobacter sp. 11ANDIMAR09]|uniref:homoprotocatechuate degradation operon regulator HpaR n=1 Tax=Phaeobacter sp. 11ANDIMAR09 TaxID=1225647 RepID=UPI0006C83D3D|nr:homoprotocatechuate degradation operon regulator HpaR [Phaeobacter sp. 11ANDIMAR09]KPD13390.1 MarR family transcriptional regulator [Phaeobacter sp. 11ANDIMAR09]
MKNRLPSTARSLPIALLRARERVMGPIRKLLSDVDLTEQQWRVLRVVQESDGIDPTEIADQACLLLPSLTRILQKLDEKGLISRERDKVDRRRQIIRITAAGEKIIEANIAASIAIVDRTREKMGEERYEALLDLLNDLDEIEL